MFSRYRVFFVGIQIAIKQYNWRPHIFPGGHPKRMTRPGLGNLESIK